MSSQAHSYQCSWSLHSANRFQPFYAEDILLELVVVVGTKSVVVSVVALT